MKFTIAPEEKKRLRRLLKFEKAAFSNGYSRIAGIDEVGRGPLAGPVVACACILKKGILIPDVNDSKQLTPEQRERVHQILTSHPDVSYAYAVVDHLTIDLINIYQASIRAMLEAVALLSEQPDLLLVDGLNLPHPSLPTQKIIGGDALSLSIAAASIIAKVERDKIMKAYHEQWPDYGFGEHKGYATPKHKKALKLLGPCPIHRRSFAPVKDLIVV